MARQSKKRGGAHHPVVSGICVFIGVELAAQAARVGALSYQVLGGVVPVGSCRLWVSLFGEAYQPADRYETTAEDLQETPVLDGLLGGNQTVSYYLEYRDAQGELLCTSDVLSTDFPPD